MHSNGAIKDNAYGTQSVDRALGILHLLAENGPMTASALADEMGMNQSTASRQLQSLIKAGYVRKPSFHSFAVDYGVLDFAGVAMRQFPIVRKALQACNSIQREAKISATVATLRPSGIVYIARVNQGVQAAIQLMDVSGWPLHRSSLGLVLSHSLGLERMHELISESCAGEEDGVELAKELVEDVDSQMTRDGFLLLSKPIRSRTNACMPFEFDGESMGFAVFGKRKLTRDEAKELLEHGIDLIGGTRR